jgi:MFS family permease
MTLLILSFEPRITSPCGPRTRGAIIANVATPVRVAGALQALGLILALNLPITPLLALAPNLPQLFRHFAGVPAVDLWVPMVLTAPSICIAVLAPMAGALVDRYGRRRMLLLAVAVFSVCGLLPLFLERLPAILAAQIGVGIGEALIMPAGNTLLGDYFAGEARQRWLGVQGILGAMLATAIVLSGGALGTVSWRAPFLMNSLGVIVFAWLLLGMWEPANLPPRATGQQSDDTRFPWRSLTRVLAVTLPIAVLYFVQAVELGLMFSHLGAGSSVTISVCTTIASIGVIAGGWYFRRQRQLRPAVNIGLILSAYAVGLTGIGLSHNYFYALPFAIVAQFGNGLTVPTLVGWSLQTLEFRYRGRGMGLWTTAFFSGQFLGPALLALMVRARADYLGAIALVGVCCTVLACGTWLFAVRRDPSAVATL